VCATVARFDVFLSHSSQDKDTVERIAERLRRAGVEPWLDKWALIPGGAWQEELGAGLDASAACAVFVGPADLGDWELQEVALAVDRAAKERGFRVFPVLLPGVREPFDPNRLPHFLRARTWVDFRRGHEDKRALQDLVHAIKGIPFGAESVTLRSDDVCPYRGLDVFDTDDAEFYFGRDAEIQRLLERLKTQRFVAVLAASGSGKSSLVRAGLLPELLRGALGGHWRACVLRPGAAPLTSLAAALTPSGAIQATLDGLRADTRTLHLALAQMVGADAPAERVVVVVDQLEEVFSLCHDDDERRALFSNLIHAASAPGGPGVVVVTIRADFYQRCAPYRELAQLVSSQGLLVGPMTRDALRQAIEEPARRVGLEFEEGLIDLILDDVGTEPGALPLLEYALLELWGRRRGSMLTLEGYRDVGGVHGALAKRADELLAGFSPTERDLTRRTLLRLTQPGEGTEDTRRRAPLSELADMEAVLDQLVGARLLTTSSEGGEQLVDVSHEALIRAWPRLRGWIDADRATLRLHRRLADAARDWERLNRDVSALYRGARLAEARELDHHELNTLEREFVAASAAYADREARRTRRRVAAIVAALLVGLLASGTAAVVAFEQKRSAQRERNIALSRHLAASSEQQLSADPELAILLAHEAARRARTTQAEHAARAALQSPFRATLRGHRGQVTLAFSSDGTLLASGGHDDQTVRIWDVGTGRQMLVRRGHARTGATEDSAIGSVSQLTFRPDGRMLASAGDDGDVRLWVLPGGRGVRLRGHQGAVIGLAFSPRGDRVLSWSLDGTARLWDPDARREVHRFDLSLPRGPIDPSLPGAAFVEGGRRLLTASREGIRLFDVDTGRIVTVWSRRPAAGLSVAVHREAPRRAGGARRQPRERAVIVNARGDRRARVWDVRADRVIATGTRTVESARMSPDGRRVLLDGSRVLDIASRREVRLLSRALDGEFSPTSDTIVTAELGGPVVWDASTGQRLAELATTESSTSAAAVGGGRVASGHDDGTIRLWDPGVLRLEEAGREIGNVAAVSPDGRYVASVSAEYAPVAWDATTGRLRLRGTDGMSNEDRADLAAHQAVDDARVEFLHDGRLVYSTLYLGRLLLYDPTGRRPMRLLVADAISANASRTATRLTDDNGDGGIRFTDLRTGRARDVSVEFSSSPNDIALSPDGRTAAVQDEEERFLFDAVRAAPLAGGPRLRITSGVRFASDGRRLFGELAADSGLIGERAARTRPTVWALPSRMVRVTLPRMDLHSTPQFSPDERQLLTDSARSVSIWDSDEGRLLLTLPSSGASAMLPNRNAIVTLGENGPPLIRSCPGCGEWNELLSRIDARAVRELSAVERRRFVDG
jgi:WD40 repeat protein